MIVQHSTLGARYCIPRHALGPSDRSRISAALTIVPPATEFGPSAPKPITYYEESDDGGLLVPRFYGVKSFGTPDNTSGVQDPAVCRRPNLDHFQGTLDETRHQRTAVTRVERALRSPTSGGGAMLCKPCGYGKTVDSCYLAHRMGVTTFVVVHTQMLLEQWRSRVAQYLPRAKVGTLRQNDVPDDDCDVVIAMLQSLAQRQYDALPPCGFIIFDECHHLPARVFRQATEAIEPAPTYVLGVSATPERRDGTSAALSWLLGDVAFQCTRQDSLRVRVLMHTFTGGAQEQRFLRSQKPNLAGMITLLGQDDARNHMLTEWIRTLMGQGRRIVVLSERVAHLHCLNDMLQPHASAAKKIAGVCIGSSSRTVRDSSASWDVIFSTYHLFREGIDIPALDTLVMATPVTSVEQAVGRIQRRCEGKQPPLVIDVVDPFSMFVGEHYKRMRFYRSERYDIEHVAEVANCASDCDLAQQRT